MQSRRLIVSDLHFGSGDDLLRSAVALERIEPELRWADELVINGDLLELVFASLEDAVAAARPFLQLVNRHVGRVHYVLGNHDHHLVTLAGDERRFADVLGAPAPGPDVAPATRLLRTLCPDVDVVSAYPVYELDGLHVTHGHHLSRPHVTATHYEGLIAPLYELMYELASAPAGRRVQQRVDRWIGGAAAIAHAPQHVSRRLAGTSTAAAPGLDVCAVHVRAAMQTVCRQLDIPPGIVVFGHTHVPLDGVTTPDGRHRLFNSGAWVVDRRPRRPQHGRCRRPGTVLRATGGVVELRELLADCDERGLERMAGAGSP